MTDVSALLDRYATLDDDGRLDLVEGLTPDERHSLAEELLRRGDPEGWGGIPESELHDPVT